MQVTTKSIKDFVSLFQKLRRFSGDSNVGYILPSGEEENNRLFMQHNLLYQYFNGNFLAPVKEYLEIGSKVLDSGCGSGVWTVDMARNYPNSTFYGIDIANVVPNEWKLKNTKYTTRDITKTLPYNSDFFDYVHQRLLVLGLTRDQWSSVLNEFYRVLKPGGYVELLEVKSHDYVNAGPLINELTDTFLKMMNERNMVPHIDTELEQMVKSAGFINVNVVRRDLPMDPEKEEGRMLWDNFYRVYDGFGSYLVNHNEKWTDLSDVKKHMDECREETEKTKSYYKYFIVYAQKPL